MRYFEDFTPGETLRFGAYEVTAEEIAEYAHSYDPSVLTPGYPRSDGETGVASSWHVCAMMMNMMCDGFVLESASLGAPGIDTLEWLAPVKAGDVLSTSYEVLETRRSASRPGVGLVRFRYEVHDRTGEKKLACENWVMFAAREGAAS
ncbi:MAG: hypothetical protein KDJ62_04645 [Rhodobiaceae bacterium]|nr:hypothetical protein [Rhodobiaceae bacterium]